jgi:hypothetical protein
MQGRNRGATEAGEPPGRTKYLSGTQQSYRGARYCDLRLHVNRVHGVYQMYFALTGE